MEEPAHERRDPLGGDEGLEPYGSVVELLDDLVDWGRALVAHMIARVPPQRRPTADGLSSLSVSHGEAAELVRAGQDHGAPEAEAELGARWARLNERLRLSAAMGHDVPLERLRGFFKLDDREMAVVMALLLPELDEQMLRLYRYAWNDFTRKKVEVGFLLELLGRDRAEREEIRKALGSSAPLRAQRLVVMGPEHKDGEEVSFLARSIRLANRLVDFLRGDDKLDEGLVGLCRVIEATRRLDQLIMPPKIMERIRMALISRRGRANTPIVLLGPKGVGKRSIAEGLACELDRPFLVADMDAIFEDGRVPEDLIALIMREARLMGSVLYLHGGPGLPESLSRPRAARIAAQLVSGTGLTIIGLTVFPGWLHAALEPMTLVRIPVPEPEVRETLWRRALPSGVRLSPTVDLQEVASRYALTGGAIIDAALAAVVKARRRSARRPTVTHDDLEAASRAQVSHNLATLAQRIVPRLGWRDLILPKEDVERLKEVVAFARNRRKVFEDWGFETKVPYGRGLSCLFSGPPGTGKTMAAGIIARELGLELFKVDLSRIVDRYVGETEKNLARVFDEAEEVHAVLLFDEADSLFSKRTAVRSSVDRYANLEVNYLLQRMEDFEGVTILTTNFDAAFDEAFRRRIKFRISFPFPDEQHRRRLWRSMFPKAAKVSRDVDWTKLARQFEMSGGHIKNAVLRAAFLAAERKLEAVDQEVLLEAAKMEYLEMGKLVRD